MNNGRGYIHGCRLGVHVSKSLFTRQPFKVLSQIGYIHGCRVSTYNCYLHGSHSRANSDYIHGCRVSTYNCYLHGSRSRANFRLCTRLPCVHIKSLFTRQPFRSQIGYNIHCRRVYTKIVIYSAAVLESGCIHKTVIYMEAIQEPTSAIYIAAGVYT